MKGLLIKDFKLLKTQNKILIAVVFVCAWFFIAGRDASYGVSYTAAMLSIMAVSTVNYDEYEHGMGFLFTFPVSRKIYVLEKFVLGIVMMAVACIAGSIFVFAQTVFLQQPYNLEAFVMALLIPMIIVSLILSVSLPIQLKYGAERSRVVLLLGVVCAGIAIYVVQEAAKICSVDLSGIEQRFRQASTAEVAVCILVLSAAMLGISYGISLAIMKRKQF